MGKPGRPKKQEDAITRMLNDADRPLNPMYAPILKEARRRGWTYAQLCREAGKDATNLRASMYARERANKGTLESVLGALKFPEPSLLARALQNQLEPADVRDILDRRLARDIDGQLERLFQARIHNALRDYLQALPLDARAWLACRYVLALHGLDDGEQDAFFPRGFGTVENALRQLKAPFSLRDFLVETAFDGRREATISAFMQLRAAVGLSPDEDGLLGCMLHPRISNSLDSRIVATRDATLRTYCEHAHGTETQPKTKRKK